MNASSNQRENIEMFATRAGRMIACCAAAAISAAVLAGCGGGERKAPSADSTAGAPAGHHHADAADEAKAHTHSTRLEFASEPAEIPAGVPAVLTLKILDAASGAPVQEYDTVHEKVMHLIIVSTDLAWFNHVHPEYKGNGTFTITTTLPTSGHYKLFADYAPRGKEHELGTHEFATTGAGPTAPPALSVDSLGSEMWITKQVTSAPEGMPGAPGGAKYQVALMPMPGTITAGQDVMLHFQVRDAAGKPLPALEPYLGAMGHCVILSDDVETYLHTHPMDGGGHHGMDHGATPPATDAAADKGKEAAAKADVIFHTNFPKPGLYKVWGQFQHNGLIITAPFVLRALPPSS